MLDIFYNEIIKEASFGRVDCGMIYNVLFETNINGKVVYKVNDNSLFVPTLMIKDKNKFDEALMKYYCEAHKFYEGTLDEDINYDKAILTLLWNNATTDDFNDPINYINRYIDFLNNSISLENDTYYSEILDSNINIQIKKEPIYEETPYALYIKSTKNNLYYDFPVVRFGISNNTCFIYAVQQEKNKKEITEDNLKYQKKIHRLLFKVNEGFNESITDNINNPENITGISPSALVSLTITLSLLNNLGIKKIIIPSFLPVRYNAKEISYKVRIDLLKSKGKDVESLNNIMHDYQENHEMIQRNISDKLLRYFRRLEYSFENINVKNLPYELDSNTHLELDNYKTCNNKLLEELYLLNNVKNKGK